MMQISHVSIWFPYQYEYYNWLTHVLFHNRSRINRSFLLVSIISCDYRDELGKSHRSNWWLTCFVCSWEKWINFIKVRVSSSICRSSVFVHTEERIFRIIFVQTAEQSMTRNVFDKLLRLFIIMIIIIICLFRHHWNNIFHRFSLFPSRLIFFPIPLFFFSFMHTHTCLLYEAQKYRYVSFFPRPMFDNYTENRRKKNAKKKKKRKEKEDDEEKILTVKTVV